MVNPGRPANVERSILRAKSKWLHDATVAIQVATVVFEVEIWSFPGAWSLVFGAFSGCGAIYMTYFAFAAGGGFVGALVAVS